MMSRELGFFGRYILLLIMQLLLCNYFMLSPYILLTLLPVMVLSIPLRYATPQVLLISFVTALAVDLLADGVPGLNVVALLPVALVRKTFIRWVFGTGLFARGEDFSIHKNGLGKVSLVILLCLALFLLTYIWLDGSGMRPAWFFYARFFASLSASYVLSLLAIVYFSINDR
ncbi:MAG: hypothetical protein II421_04350 [Bacteroidales bacterium]|nr:hypothetical protein [Bacteroidales bacterium]